MESLTALSLSPDISHNMNFVDEVCWCKNTYFLFKFPRKQVFTNTGIAKIFSFFFYFKIILYINLVRKCNNSEACRYCLLFLQRWTVHVVELIFRTTSALEG